MIKEEKEIITTVTKKYTQCDYCKTENVEVFTVSSLAEKWYDRNKDKDSPYGNYCHPNHKPEYVNVKKDLCKNCLKNAVLFKETKYDPRTYSPPVFKFEKNTNFDKEPITVDSFKSLTDLNNEEWT